LETPTNVRPSSELGFSWNSWRSGPKVGLEFDADRNVPEFIGRRPFGDNTRIQNMQGVIEVEYIPGMKSRLVPTANAITFASLLERNMAKLQKNCMIDGGLHTSVHSSSFRCDDDDETIIDKNTGNCALQATSLRRRICTGHDATTHKDPLSLLLKSNVTWTSLALSGGRWLGMKRHRLAIRHCSNRWLA
jgi:hypothetical protein